MSATVTRRSISRKDKRIAAIHKRNYTLTSNIFVNNQGVPVSVLGSKRKSKIRGGTAAVNDRAALKPLLYNKIVTDADSTIKCKHTNGRSTPICLGTINSDFNQMSRKSSEIKVWQGSPPIHGESRQVIYQKTP
jgi:hypothetical protein